MYGKKNGKRIRLEGGEYFAVPLENGEFSYGQFIKDSPSALNSCICVFFIEKAKDIESLRGLAAAEKPKPLSLLFVTKELLRNGTWEIFDSGKIGFQENQLPDYQFEKVGSYKSAKIYGAGVVRKLLNAYHGLLPWTMMKDPNFFDNLIFNWPKKSRR